MKVIVPIFFTVALLLSFFQVSRAEVVVYDRIGVAGKPVTLKARTKGVIFAKGGERIEFDLNGKIIGRTLSGGDGYAYLEFVPRKRGMSIITVKTNDDQGEGMVLIVDRSSPVVCIDVMGSIIESPFPLKPRKGSHDALRAIAKRFPLVYLAAGIPGEGFMKEWLEDHGYPEGVVLPLDEGNIFGTFAEIGVRLKAVIGSASVIDSAKKYKPLAVSFEESANAKKVESWEEIPALIK